MRSSIGFTDFSIFADFERFIAFPMDFVAFPDFRDFAVGRRLLELITYVGRRKGKLRAC